MKEPHFGVATMYRSGITGLSMKQQPTVGVGKLGTNGSKYSAVFGYGCGRKAYSRDPALSGRGHTQTSCSEASLVDGIQ